MPASNRGGRVSATSWRWAGAKKNRRQLALLRFMFRSGPRVKGPAGVGASRGKLAHLTPAGNSTEPGRASMEALRSGQLQQLRERDCALWQAAAAGAPACPEPADAQPVGVQKIASPSGTTGDKLTTGTGVVVRHDWLNVTAPLAMREKIQAFVETYLGAAVQRDRGANTYAHSVAWESGALLAWTEDRAECWLSINGDSCDLILPELKLEFLQGLRGLGAKCTRVDAAIDVRRDLLTMERVHAAARADHVVGFRRYEPVQPVRDMRTGELAEDQARFGRRGRDGSGRFVRVYDKGLESDGELDCVRVEVELSGDMAAQVFELMLCGASDLAELERNLGRCVVASIDFADKSGAHGHRDRFERLTWWQRIVDLVGSATIAVERVQPTLERSVEFIKRVAPMIFARLVRAVDLAGMAGEQLLSQLVSDLLERGQQKLELVGGARPGDLRIDVGAILANGGAS